MLPDYTNLYLVTIRKWKPSGIEKDFISEEESFKTIGEDVETAIQTAREYITIMVTNTDWTVADVINISLLNEIFLGIAPDEDDEEEFVQEFVTELGKEEGGVIQDGFKGMPCQTHQD